MYRPSSHDRGRSRKMARAAAVDICRVAGVASVERWDSIACVSASIPVAAVTCGGSPSIRFGSSAIAAGTSLLSTIANLRFAAGSETTDSDGHLRAGPCRGRNREERRHRRSDLEVAVEVLRSAAGCAACDHCFRGVDRRTAADRQDRGRARRSESLDARHDDVDGGIRLDIREHRHLEAGLPQRGQYRIDDPQLDEHGVRHDEDRSSATVGDHSGELDGRARPREHERRGRRHDASYCAERANAETREEVAHASFLDELCRARGGSISHEAPTPAA